MKCNFQCTYCNQASQPHTISGNMQDVDHFLKNLGHWFDGGPNKDGTGIRVELWGGEPLVYVKQLRKLVDVLRSLYPNLSFLMITNGTLLTDDIINWIDDVGMSIAISHDGAAYSDQRGPDPLLDPKLREPILKLYNRLNPFGRISFNCVLTKNNMSVVAVRKFIADHLGVPEYEINIGTEEILQPYDAGGIALSPKTYSEHLYLLMTVYWEIVKQKSSTISTISNKMADFWRSIAFGRPSHTLGQKCGMDDEGTIAVDLQGNVLTCQNTSADGGHKIGHVRDFENIALTTSWHWSLREECGRCPVVQLCKGACMYNQGENWTQGCDNAFTYNLALLAASLFFPTRMILEYIEGPVIRRDSLPTKIPVISFTDAKFHATDSLPSPEIL